MYPIIYRYLLAFLGVEYFSRRPDLVGVMLDTDALTFGVLIWVKMEWQYIIYNQEQVLESLHVNNQLKLRLIANVLTENL